MVLTKITELQTWDKVDLEGDKYADPDRDHPSYPFIYGEVELVERETDTCAVVYFTDGTVIGFPVDHQLLKAN